MLVQAQARVARPGRGTPRTPKGGHGGATKGTPGQARAGQGSTRGCRYLSSSVLEANDGDTHPWHGHHDAADSIRAGGSSSSKQQAAAAALVGTLRRGARAGQGMAGQQGALLGGYDMTRGLLSLSL